MNTIGRFGFLFTPLLTAAVIAASCSSGSSTTTGSPLTCGPGTHDVDGQCLAVSGSTGTAGGSSSSTTASSTTASGTGGASNSSSTTSSSTGGAGGKGGAGGTGGSPSYTETALTLALSFAPAVPVPDGGAGDGGAPLSKLVITARDGTTPVVTNLWLYTLDDMGNKTPLTGFTSTQARKSPRLMLPATINGQPSGLSPANDGNANGTMTCSCARGSLNQGAFTDTVTGTVTVTLPATPTTPILVVAGVEDQRYGGAAAINPDGSPATVPAGAVDLQTHTRVSFKNDVLPILKATCASCHASTDPSSDAGAGVGVLYNSNFYYVDGTPNDLVNGNYALNEQTLTCQMAHPGGGVALAQCIQAITGAQFLVEPGAPAASDLLQRSRPDENGGTSPEGILWYGSKGSRYSAKYGDRRMPSTTQDMAADAGNWNDQPCYFDSVPSDFQLIWNWVAQGAISN